MRFMSPVLVCLAAASALVAATTTPTTPAPSTATATSTPQSTDKPLKLNGWYPCSRSKTTALQSAPAFECAEVEVPLCHTGVCTSTKTINLFVKRLARDAAHPVTAPASNSSSKQSKRAAMWILQGGPGYSSQAMEGHMLTFNKTMGGAVDLYTLDHRGTGRSSFLECQAAQAYAAGSPGGVSVRYTEVGNCIRDILFQIDNHTEAFSVTSAAKDVAYLVSTLNRANGDVFVYGASYGTYWASRIMHLAPTQIAGYILDGVVDESSPTFTTWNTNKQFAEARFIELCERDAFCRRKLVREIETHGSLAAAWRALYGQIDAAAPGTNSCADLVRQLPRTGSKPSHSLREVLGSKVTKVHERLVIPAIVHRLSRCRPQDVTFLAKLFHVKAPERRAAYDRAADPQILMKAKHPPEAYNQVFAGSPFLGMLIRASAMWTKPSPSWADEMKEFDAGLLSTSMAYTYNMYCLFHGNLSDPACANLVATHPEIQAASLPRVPFEYKPDKYWKTFATIPAHASAMVINGGLDFQTVREWGRTEYANLRGGPKILVEFENGHHCTGLGATTSSDTTQCGYKITSSYVLHGGRVDNVDTSCMAMLPALDFADIAAIRRVVNVKTADDLYD